MCQHTSYNHLIHAENEMVAHITCPAVKTVTLQVHQRNIQKASNRTAMHSCQNQFCERTEIPHITS